MAIFRASGYTTFQQEETGLIMKIDFDYSLYHSQYRSDEKAYMDYHARHLAHYIARWLTSVDKEAPILDFGCGVGCFLEALKQAGFTQRIGIDTSFGMVERCVTLGNSAEHVAESLQFLIQHPGHFGAIVMMDVLEHLPTSSHLEYFKALRSALKPGGLLLLRVPNADSAVATHMRYSDITHHACFSPRVIEFFLQLSGMTKLDIDDEIPYLNRPRHLWPHHKNTWIYLCYRFISTFFRAWRRLELSAYLGFEFGMATPIAPNFVVLSQRPLE